MYLSQSEPFWIWGVSKKVGEQVLQMLEAQLRGI